MHLTAVIAVFLVLAPLSWGAFSPQPKALSLGMGVSWDHWQGQNPFEWEEKTSYPSPAKTHTQAKIGFTWLWAADWYSEVELPFFWNRILEYHTIDQYGLPFSAEGYSIGVGDVGVSLKKNMPAGFIKLDWTIPGLYNPKSEVDGVVPDTVAEGENQASQVRLLKSWTGMGVHRLGFLAGFKEKYRHLEGEWMMYTGIDLVLGDQGDFNWWANQLFGRNLNDSHDYGSGLVSAGDSKFKVGAVHSGKISPRAKLKVGLQLSHGRYHWYGPDQDPRSEITLEPSTGVDFKLAPGYYLGATLGFTAYNSLIDSFLPVAGKKVYLNLGFNSYF